MHGRALTYPSSPHPPRLGRHARADGLEEQSLGSISEGSQSCSTFPSSASVLMPSARKGLTGPQLASVLQSEFDKDGKFDKEGKRCAAAQSHTLRSPFTNHSH